jgi:hypothetical protein
LARLFPPSLRISKVPAFILLNVPWGIFGPSENRVQFDREDAKVSTEFAVAPLLFSNDDLDVYWNGRPDALQRFARIRTRTHDPQNLFEMPVPLAGGEPQSLRHSTWRKELTFQLQFAVDRPIHRADEALGLKEVGWPWHRFLMAINARMQDFEAALGDAEDPWEFVLDRWLTPKSERDPTMDVLVRHALEHRYRWPEIAEHPRRLLNRRREQVPLSRVQELDTQCMQWLSRQPGNTLAERAGGRQRILALARYENRNTLENRVFRDLLERTAIASQEYIELNHGRSASTAGRRSVRYKIVQQYGRESRRLGMELSEQGVSRAPDVVQPNYVLLHDNRYRHVWNAWQEIIHRERVMDDLWRWQRRSWTEFCKMTVAMSLIAQPRTHLVAASPIFFRPEHHRGEWILHDDPLAVIANEQKGWVAEVLSGNSPDVPLLVKELGAAVWLRFSDFSGGIYKYLPIWTAHCFQNGPTLSDVVESANESFRYHKAVYRNLRDMPSLVGGMVCLSILAPEAETVVQSAEFVTGVSFGPDDEQLSTALSCIGDELSALIEAAL